MGIFNWATNKAGRMIGFQRLKEDTLFLFRLPKQYAELHKRDIPEAPFKKLSRDVLEAKKKNYLNLCKFALFMFFLFLCLDTYQFYKGDFLAGLGCLIASSIPGALVIKYHFYYTVLKKKKLITIKEYFEGFKKDIK